MKPIRKEYEDLGVDGFYKKSGWHYTNPHEPQIAILLEQNKSNINYEKTLDFCCGSGEVTASLAEMGFENTTGSDPYTRQAFKKRTGKKALSLSFDEVIRKGLPEKYTAVIASFALHLCPPEKLFPLAMQIFESTTQLVVITPHKRPELEKLDGINLILTDQTPTPKGKQVRLKIYERAY